MPQKQFTIHASENVLFITEKAFNFVILCTNSICVPSKPTLLGTLVHLHIHAEI